MKNKSTLSTWAYYVAITILVVTHVYMLVAGLPAEQMTAHAIINLFAGVLFAYSWFGK